MDTGEILILGGVGLAAFLLYQSASSAADVLTPPFPGGGGASSTGGGNWFTAMANNAANAVTSAAAGAVTAVTGGASSVLTAPAAFNCGDAWASNQLPAGAGSWPYPDNYVIPCMGGATVGQLRAVASDDTEVMQTIATAECACAAAQEQKLPIKNNLIQTAPSGLSGVGVVPHGLHHRYYVRQADGWPADQFPRGHGLYM